MPDDKVELWPESVQDLLTKDNRYTLALNKPCRYCGRQGHQSLVCGYKPNKKLKSGKVAVRWTQTRKQWMRDNPPPWVCYICGKYLDEHTMVIDHVQSRSRHPELRFEVSNLRPACVPCNERKGSRDLEETRM